MTAYDAVIKPAIHRKLEITEMTKSAVPRFFRHGVFQERRIYRRKIRAKQDVFIARKLIANGKKSLQMPGF